MKFLLDESADYPLAAALQSHGHDVTAIAHDYPRSLKDHEVLAIAYAESRILITNDRDFGDLIVRQHFAHAGVILFRLGDETLANKIAWLERVLADHADQLHQFIVVTERGVRVRRISEA
jgi:predicted nuclease of predicted toxin-antitoxin system